MIAAVNFANNASPGGIITSIKFSITSFQKNAPRVKPYITVCSILNLIFWLDKVIQK